ncbi:AcrR family transcriptional regulator [Anaerosolibacter carboniphilus]|uniref:AcrR family transcriptional regulator n=1 Tax=Anaerosolibacter carboniphilus TaxID=1417629 RepID=A0A841KPD5_9FIRM|nr:TetR/AcrR family transcriptional regulator [Anaerosolibacter carboniphilus]MBB6213968.1 AcrR family transcriptional regulator [Anaerosolibacter carboniphilus]
MARVTDPQKIEDVKRAAMEIVVEYGYRGASIASIAKKAGVSVGYLYRYYKSKEELLEDLMNTHLGEIKNELLGDAMASSTIYEFVYNLIHTVFRLAIEDTIYAQMLATLVLDVDIEKIMGQRDKEFKSKAIERITELGKLTGEIGEHVDEEDIILILMTIPFRYVLLKIKEDHHERFFQKEHAARIAKICFNALG